MVLPAFDPTHLLESVRKLINLSIYVLCVRINCAIMIHAHLTFHSKFK